MIEAQQAMSTSVLRLLARIGGRRGSSSFPTTTTTRAAGIWKRKPGKGKLLNCHEMNVDGDKLSRVGRDFFFRLEGERRVFVDVKSSSRYS